MSYLQSYTMPQISAHLSELLVSERFLRSQIPGNGLPIYVCAYPMHLDGAMRTLPQQLINYLAPHGINAIHINMYQLALAELESRNQLDQYLTNEPRVSKTQLLTMLNNTCNVERYLIPRIKTQIDAHTPQMVFIDGIGAAYPFIRAHTILNHLDKVATGTPVVVFFPGSYRSSDRTGMTLNLFGIIDDDNYYRAINIMEVK